MKHQECHFRPTIYFSRYVSVHTYRYEFVHHPNFTYALDIIQTNFLTKIVRSNLHKKIISAGELVGTYGMWLMIKKMSLCVCII